MQTSELHPWPHGDTEQDARLRGLVRLGLAEAVRIDGELHYRFLGGDAPALGAAYCDVDRELTVE